VADRPDISNRQDEGALEAAAGWCLAAALIVLGAATALGLT
jgi:hypothetical protein